MTDEAALLIDTTLKNGCVDAGFPFYFSASTDQLVVRHLAAPVVDEDPKCHQKAKYAHHHGCQQSGRMLQLVEVGNEHSPDGQARPQGPARAV